MPKHGTTTKRGSRVSNGPVPRRGHKVSPIPYQGERMTTKEFIALSQRKGRRKKGGGQ